MFFLRAAGADFLTAAFHAFGTLAPDNRVARVLRCEPFAGGNSGQNQISELGDMDDFDQFNMERNQRQDRSAQRLAKPRRRSVA